jgi:hypothetical protein
LRSQSRKPLVAQFEQTAQTRSHPEGLLVPKDLARIAAVAGPVHIRSAQDASQAQHDAPAEVEDFQTEPLPENPIAPNCISCCDLQTNMIRKLKSGEYRLYSRKKNPKTGRRRNLGTFSTRAGAMKHERDVQYFKKR